MRRQEEPKADDMNTLGEKQVEVNHEKPHEIVHFMRQMNDEIAAEYSRIRTRDGEDPGTSGDEGEENWAELLRDWLPSSYEVTTKGRIIGERGETSQQVDVIVLKQFYPMKLRYKKHFLAAGVAAVFECKNTLRAKHIEQAVKMSAEVKRLAQNRGGTPYKDMHSQIVCGLLAHSHEWQEAGSRPVENVERNLREADGRHVMHPRECMDVLCIADLGLWSSYKITQMDNPNALALGRGSTNVVGMDKSPLSGHLGRDIESSEADSGFTPTGILIASLMKRLAWEVPELREMSDYYTRTVPFGLGRGGSRYWTNEQLSDNVVEFLRGGGSLTNTNWNEWNNIFFA